MKQLFFIALSIVTITHTSERTGPSNTNYASNADLSNTQLMIYIKSAVDFMLYHLAQQEARQNNQFRQIIANQNKFCQSINSSLAGLSSRVDYLVESGERRDTTIRELEKEITTTKRDIARLQDNIALLSAQKQTRQLWSIPATPTTTSIVPRRDRQFMEKERTSSFM